MSTGQLLVGKTEKPSHTVSVASCPYWLSGVTEMVKCINNDNLSTTVAYTQGNTEFSITLFKS